MQFSYPLLFKFLILRLPSSGVDYFDNDCSLILLCPKLQTQFSRKPAQNVRFQWLNTSALGLFSLKRGSINSGTFEGPLILPANGYQY
jgi:hypothetical protein